MTKKYVAILYDSKYNPICGYGKPIYGTLTLGKFNDVLDFAKKKKAYLIVIRRRTEGKFITEFAYYIKTEKLVSGKNFILP